MAAGDITIQQNFNLIQTGAGSHSPVDFDTDSLRVGLVYTDTAITQADQDWADVEAQEVAAISGTYAQHTSAGTGDQPVLGTITVGLNGTTTEFDAADVTFSQDGTGWTTNKPRCAYIFKYDTNDPSSPLVCFLDLGQDRDVVAGDLVFQWNASGILNWTIS